MQLLLQVEKKVFKKMLKESLSTTDCLGRQVQFEGALFAFCFWSSDVFTL